MLHAERDQDLFGTRADAAARQQLRADLFDEVRIVGVPRIRRPGLYLATDSATRFVSRHSAAGTGTDHTGRRRTHKGNGANLAAG